MTRCRFKIVSHEIVAGEVVSAPQVTVDSRWAAESRLREMVSAKEAEYKAPVIGAMGARCEYHLEASESLIKIVIIARTVGADKTTVKVVH